MGTSVQCVTTFKSHRSCFIVQLSGFYFYMCTIPLVLGFIILEIILLFIINIWKKHSMQQTLSNFIRISAHDFRKIRQLK